MTHPSPDRHLSRRALPAAGAAVGTAGCVGSSGPLVGRFNEPDLLVTYDRIGTGSTPLTHRTNTFYTPARTGNNQPELSPLTGPFYKRGRTSASGLDPEGEVRTLIKQSTVSTDTVAT
ncbi:MAG: hypothetical protein V5A15_01380 [Haloarcula sp.]